MPSCAQACPTQKLIYAADLPGLTYLQLQQLSSPWRTVELQACPKYCDQTCSKPWFSHMPAGQRPCLAFSVLSPGPCMCWPHVFFFTIPAPKTVRWFHFYSFVYLFIHLLFLLKSQIYRDEQRQRRPSVLSAAAQILSQDSGSRSFHWF